MVAVMIRLAARGADDEIKRAGFEELDDRGGDGRQGPFCAGG